MPGIGTIAKWLGWRGGVALAMSLACVLLWMRANHWQGEAEDALQLGADERANHIQTKASYRTAQQQAQAAADAERARIETLTTRFAERADHDSAEIARLRSAARRFADAGGLRTEAGAGAGSPTGATKAAREDQPAPRDDRPGGTAVLPVTLTREDFDILNRNTERLVKLHQLGEDWKAAGLAQNAPP